MGRRSARSVIIMRHQIISGAFKRVLLRLLTRTEEAGGGQSFILLKAGEAGRRQPVGRYPRTS